MTSPDHFYIKHQCYFSSCFVIVYDKTELKKKLCYWGSYQYDVLIKLLLIVEDKIKYYLYERNILIINGYASLTVVIENLYHVGNCEYSGNKNCNIVNTDLDYFAGERVGMCIQCPMAQCRIEDISNLCVCVCV